MQAKFYSEKELESRLLKAQDGIKILEKVEFANSQSEGYFKKAKDTVLSEPLGQTKAGVKCRNGVFW